MEDNTRKKFYLIFTIVSFFALFNLIVLPLALKGIRIDNESFFGRVSILYYLFFLPFLLSASLVTLVSLKLNRQLLTIFSLIGFVIGYSMYFLMQWLQSLGGPIGVLWMIMYVFLIVVWPFSFLFPSGDGGMIVWVFTPATLSFIGGIIGASLSFLIRKPKKK